MNIYNNDGKSNRRKSACGYCRAVGHNQTECPRVAEDYAWFTQSPPVIPIGISKSPNTCSWYSNPKYWGEWYNNCMTAYAKQQEAKKRGNTTRKRSASKCGFCGSTAHNRRNCEKMDAYTADAISANRNWRKMFHEVFVQQMGISEGALLNLKSERGYGSNRKVEEFIGVVTGVNWDELSLFCASKDHSDGWHYMKEEYIQRLKVTVQVGNETTRVTFGRTGIGVRMSNSLNRNLVKHSGDRYNWENLDFVSVLSPSETPLGAEWIEEGHAKAMGFLTKKRSQEKLAEEGVTDLINLWL